MATQEKVRHKQEQGMLNNIGGRDEPVAEPKPRKPVGWMGYVGGVLWATVFCAAGLIAWLFMTKGG